MSEGTFEPSFQGRFADWMQSPAQIWNELAQKTRSFVHILSVSNHTRRGNSHVRDTLFVRLQVFRTSWGPIWGLASSVAFPTRTLMQLSSGHRQLARATRESITKYDFIGCRTRQLGLVS